MADDDAPKPQLEAQDDPPKPQLEAQDDPPKPQLEAQADSGDTSTVTQETGNLPVVEDEKPSTEETPPEHEESDSALAATPLKQEESEPAPAATEATPLAQEASDPAPAATEATPLAQEASDPAPDVTERASETSPLAAEELEASSTAKETPSELGQVAKQLIPHILNLYNSCPTATDFDAIYAPDAIFEDPFAQAHGVGQIKSAFYAMPKVFLDSTVLKYTVEEEQTAPKSGEIRLDNLQQYKLLQLGPIGHYVTIRSLIKLKVEAGKVVRHEDLWGGYRLWNRHTVRVPLVGRMAETLRKGIVLVTHVLMGFGKDHKTLDKPRDANSSVRLVAA